MSLTSKEWKQFLQIQGYLTAEQDRKIVADYERLETRLAALSSPPSPVLTSSIAGDHTGMHWDGLAGTWRPDQASPEPTSRLEPVTHDDEPPSREMERKAFVAGAKWAWVIEGYEWIEAQAEAARRYPDPALGAFLPDSTHAGDPDVYPHSGATRKVVGHVAPGAPAMRWVCDGCGATHIQPELVLSDARGTYHWLGETQCGPVRREEEET